MFDGELSHFGVPIRASLRPDWYYNTPTVELGGSQLHQSIRVVTVAELDDEGPRQGILNTTLRTSYRTVGSGLFHTFGLCPDPASS